MMQRRGGNTLGNNVPLIFLAYWLHMDGDVRLLTIAFLEQAFHLGGLVVGFLQRDVAVHEDVHVYGLVVTDTAGAKIMRLGDP